MVTGEWFDFEIDVINVLCTHLHREISYWHNADQSVCPAPVGCSLGVDMDFNVHGDTGAMWWPLTTWVNGQMSGLECGRGVNRSEHFF